MRAVVATGGRLELIDAPDPVPGPGQLLVAVRAAGLNRADLLMVRGGYVVGRSLQAPTGGASAPPAAVPMGGELAGEVVAIGPAVAGRAEGRFEVGFEVGDAVMSMARGAYAELALVDAARAMPVPAGLGWEEAGAFPTTFITAHDALASAGRLEPGGSVLVNAASSGVGVAALQLAHLLGAGRVLASSTSESKLAALHLRGVPFDVGVVAGDADVVESLLAATDGRGVDLVIDSVGGPAWATNLAATALGGRIVSVGRVGGLTAEVNLDEVARKRVSLVGVTFRTRSADEARAVVAAAARDLVPALAAGRLQVLVDRTFPLEEATDAHAYLRRNEHVGKVVLVTG